MSFAGGRLGDFCCIISCGSFFVTELERTQRRQSVCSVSLKRPRRHVFFTHRQRTATFPFFRRKVTLNNLKEALELYNEDEPLYDTPVFALLTSLEVAVRLRRNLLYLFSSKFTMSPHFVIPSRATVVPFDLDSTRSNVHTRSIGRDPPHIRCGGDEGTARKTSFQ